MKTFTPYIGFNGTCREAMTFYRDCLGGNLEFLTVGESPMASQSPAEAQNLVMHSSLTNGNCVVMATDMGEADYKGMAVAIDCSNEDEINSIFGKLSAGGEVKCPVSPAFWGGTFGACTDKFGIHWMLTLAA